MFINALGLNLKTKQRKGYYNWVNEKITNVVFYIK